MTDINEKPIRVSLDQAYCASPECKNDCGRKLTLEQEEALKKIKYHRVAFSYFCGEPK